VYEKLKSNLSPMLSQIAHIAEAAIASILVAGILFLLARMILEYGRIVLLGGSFEFSSLLTRALDLIIGIEFTKMLCRHAPDAIIEVLMFATARQAIIDHSRMLENLLAVIAISILFAVKKYILSENTREKIGRMI